MDMQNRLAAPSGETPLPFLSADQACFSRSRFQEQEQTYGRFAPPLRTFIDAVGLRESRRSAWRLLLSRQGHSCAKSQFLALAPPLKRTSAHCLRSAVNRPLTTAFKIGEAARLILHSGDPRFVQRSSRSCSRSLAKVFDITFIVRIFGLLGCSTLV